MGPLTIRVLIVIVAFKDSKLPKSWTFSYSDTVMQEDNKGLSLFFFYFFFSVVGFELLFPTILQDEIIVF